MREINNDIIHDKLFDKKPLLAYDESRDYKAWKEEVRQKYIELLGIDRIKENECEIKVEIEECVEKDGYTRYRYVFERKEGKIPRMHLFARAYDGFPYFHRGKETRSRREIFANEHVCFGRRKARLRGALHRAARYG